MRRNKVLIIFLLIIILFTVGCNNNEQEENKGTNDINKDKNSSSMNFNNNEKNDEYEFSIELLTYEEIIEDENWNVALDYYLENRVLFTDNERYKYLNKLKEEIFLRHEQYNQVLSLICNLNGEENETYKNEDIYYKKFYDPNGNRVYVGSLNENIQKTVNEVLEDESHFFAKSYIVKDNKIFLNGFKAVLKEELYEKLEKALEGENNKIEYFETNDTKRLFKDILTKEGYAHYPVNTTNLMLEPNNDYTKGYKIEIKDNKEIIISYDNTNDNVTVVSIEDIRDEIPGALEISNLYKTTKESEVIYEISVLEGNNKVYKLNIQTLDSVFLSDGSIYKILKDEEFENNIIIEKEITDQKNNYVLINSSGEIKNNLGDKIYKNIYRQIEYAEKGIKNEIYNEVSIEYPMYNAVVIPDYDNEENIEKLRKRKIPIGNYQVDTFSFAVIGKIENVIIEYSLASEPNIITEVEAGTLENCYIIVQTELLSAKSSIDVQYWAEKSSGDYVLGEFNMSTDKTKDDYEIFLH